MGLLGTVIDVLVKAATAPGGLTVDKMKALYAKYGVPWKPFNLFGVLYDENQKEDVFNDVIGGVTDTEIVAFRGTCNPGWEATMKKAGGAAHLCLGYHPDIWMIGQHAQGTPFEHRAFSQIGGPVKIWRDIHRDGVQEADDPIQTGWFGINMHRAAINGSERIGPYSYGCQVLQKPEYLAKLLEMADASGLKKFSYMLFDKAQIV